MGLVSTLRSTLSTLAPFDAGELALSMPTGFRRWTFTDEEDPVAERPARRRRAHDVPLRIDQPEEAARFAETAARMRRRGFMSMLAVPLNAAGGPDGAVVLARRFGWAYAGTSMRAVSVCVSMAGICLRAFPRAHRVPPRARGGRASACASSKAATVDRGRPGRVLLVDDEPALLEIMAEVLQEAGFTVETAKDGLQALARIEASEPEVVVADVEMGVMSGYELCRRVRPPAAIRSRSCSAPDAARPILRVEGLQAGADDYLVKPVTSEELILKLARQVDRARKLREASSAAAAAVVNAATLAAIEARLDVQGSAIVRLGRFECAPFSAVGPWAPSSRPVDTKLERWVAIKTARAGAGMAEFWDRRRRARSWSRKRPRWRASTIRTWCRCTTCRTRRTRRTS